MPDVEKVSLTPAEQGMVLSGRMGGSPVGVVAVVEHLIRERIRRMEKILNGARALHREIPIYPGDCEDESGEHAFDPAEEFCRDCPPEMHACETCRDEDGSWIEWPCETATALDPNAWVDDLVREAALSLPSANPTEEDA